MHRLPYALLALTLTACLKPAPEQLAAQEYAGQLFPLLEDNALLAHEVLTLAASVHDKESTPEQTIERWRTRVVPLAAHLEQQVALISPPPTWQQTHGELVTVWSARAEAYADIDEALVARDTRQWNQARAAADQVKLDEEKWFTHIHNDMAAHGIAVDQYPQISSLPTP
ncbi:MAG: hypothetical protein JXX28_13480 [Deltaproteobacteria bacterium]|nr:hypothetical protein [Deltaproteobacteria bacterium]